MEEEHGCGEFSLTLWRSLREDGELEYRKFFGDQRLSVGIRRNRRTTLSG